MFLVDTNVISELSPVKMQPNPNVRAWLLQAGHTVVISVVTLMEVDFGIARASRSGAQRKAAALTQWRDELVTSYGATMLPVGLDVAARAGQLKSVAEGLGITPGVEDILIAATALDHHLTLATRNERHFRPLGVTVVNPYLIV